MSATQTISCVYLCCNDSSKLLSPCSSIKMTNRIVTIGKAINEKLK